MLVAHDIDKQGFSKWLLAIVGHGEHLVNHERLTDGGNSAEDMKGCPFPRLRRFFHFRKLGPHKTSPKEKVPTGVRTVTHT